MDGQDFFENQSGSKPQWRIVQTDDTMTLQRYTAVIPGTHAELLQEASTDEFHKIESGSIQDSTVKELGRKIILRTVEQ